MQREFEMSTNMHILGGLGGGVQQRRLRVKILNKRKNPPKKVLFKSFIESLGGGFFFKQEKNHVEEKQKLFNMQESLYVRSHIECEKRNSAVLGLVSI